MSRSMVPKITCLFAFFFLFFLASCSKVTQKSSGMYHKASSPFALSVDSYLSMAESQVGVERNHLLLMAAGRAVYDGQWQRANNILAQVQSLSSLELQQKKVLLAKIAVIQTLPQKALTLLSSIPSSENLPPYYQMLYHEVLSVAYEATKKPSLALRQRMKLDHLLPEESMRIHNRRMLWLTLSKMPWSELDTLSLEAREGVERKGWLELALIAKKKVKNGQELISNVQAWQQQYPGHPALTLLPSPLAAVTLIDTPRNIAVLLPLSGPLSGPGNAVKEGIVAGYQMQHPSSQTLHFYDTEAKDVASLYEGVLRAGADYVIGPLQKKEVAIVSTLPHPVPTIFLNEATQIPRGNAYYFGLSPTNEARQVAVKAQKMGKKRVLILAPLSSWGQYIVKAFTAQWQLSQGVVVETFYYDNQTKLDVALREFLHVSQKDADAKPQKRMKGEPKTSMVEKRRQDFDSIFLVAYPSLARQLMPLLKYYFVGKEIAVFATSSVYAGNTNTMLDKDLDGIIFCDMPWVFTHSFPNKHWPEQWNSYGRLYAMGRDSYLLSRQLNQLLLFPALKIQEDSGVLYLNQAKKIARILPFAAFRGGIAEVESMH